MTTPRGPQPFAGQEKRLRLLAFVRQDSIVRVDKRVEDTAMVWPHLLVIEFIASMLWSIGLFVIAAAFNAPLQDHATPDCTPNPSKAPWYLLNLQELLLHMDKGLAGVIVPTVWLTFMAVIPYIDTSREGVGIWFTSANGKRITIFAAVYATVLTFSLILLDAFLKRPEDQGGFGYIEKATRYLPGGKQLFPNYIIPIVLMIGLSVLLVLIVKRLYAANTREWMIAIYTGFVAVYLVLTVVGTSMRGPGMDLFAPWAVPATHQCLEPKA
ncbi:MAG TPA: menaquinol-cytochrome C reductase [Candidatus Limnocylindria bacterium]|nr:MAG: menaquinol-cytochrome C reductase [Chloroflexota bacterium]